ncbi:MAG: hypothetical protein PVF29_12680 [Desulfobacterales bacterium]
MILIILMILLVGVVGFVYWRQYNEPTTDMHYSGMIEAIQADLAF